MIKDGIAITAVAMIGFGLYHIYAPLVAIWFGSVALIVIYLSVPRRR